MTVVGSVAEIWRYPVKSMGGEHLARSAITTRGVHADRMWAVRDVELDTFTTARRWPVLLQCSARFVEDPAGRSADPGDVLEVVVTLPDGEEVSSSDPAIHDRLSEQIGKPARLESLPALSEKGRYRTPQPTKADMRRQFAIPDGEPLPDFSMFPVRKLAELARYATPVGALYDAYPILLVTRASLRALADRSPGLAVRRPSLQAQRAPRPRRRGACGVRLVWRTAPRTECGIRRRHPRSALLDSDPRAGRPASRPRRPADHQRSRGP